MAADGDSGDADDSVVDAGDGDGSPVTVNVRCSNGSEFSVRVPLGPTVGSFKAIVAEKSDIPAELQRLIYKGRILNDDQTVESYGLGSDHTIHLVRGFAPSSSPSAPTGTNAGSLRSLDDTQGTGRGLGSNEGGALGTRRGASFGGTPFPVFGVTGMRAHGASGFSRARFLDFDQVRQQLTQNPDMLREIRNLPAVQNLANNPDLMRNLIMGNPVMRDTIDQNPELAHILNDPNTLRQTLEAARNLELMREMMRNTDRAMSNIESSPEGFNMLRRMYETVQEPFLNATTTATENGTDMVWNPLAALLGNLGTPQNSDRPANPSTNNSETTGSPAPNTNPLPNPWSNPAARGAQNNNTASSPTGSNRVPGFIVLGGLAFPELERMIGSRQNQSLLNQVMQSPAMTQIMQSSLSDPQYMNQILNLNPQMRSLLESNNQLREMLQNQEFLRQLTSPETMQQLPTLQQSLLSLGRLEQGQEPNQAGGDAGTPSNMGLALLTNVLSGFGAGGPSVPNTSDVPPEQFYATQLSQLQEMGFFDTQENIRALSATAGNVHAAAEHLLGNPGQ